MALDCTTCGLCCAPPKDQAIWVDLSQEDLERLIPDFVLRNVIKWRTKSKPDVIRTAIRTRKMGDRLMCSAFQGEPGKSASCSIYLVRPASCRRLSAGCSYCLELRAKHGL